MKLFGTFVAGVILTVISFVAYGFVFTKLWHWFIVPIFGMADLGIAAALGLIGIAVYLNRTAIKSTKLGDREFFDAICKSIGRSLVMLGLCWVIHLFM